MPHTIHPSDTTAAVRFLNNTAGEATLLADGRPLFGGIEAGSVTPWREIGIDAVTFALGAAGDGPFVTQRLMGGSRYTVTARAALESESTLTIVREAEPASAIADR